MYKRIFIMILVLTSAFIPMIAAAGSLDQITYCRGVIESIASPILGSETPVKVRLMTCDSQGTIVMATRSGENSNTDIALPTYRVGDSVIVSKPQIPGQNATYSLIDHYRLPQAALWLSVAVVLGIIFAGWRGLGSIIGLFISLGVLGGFVVPQILHGSNPYSVMIAASFMIATLGIYAAHGISKRTTIALVGIYLTLILVLGLSTLALQLAHLNGISSEDISYLHQQLPNLNIRGLLFGGIILGVVGVLDDIAVGQAATVDELRRANPKLTWRELYRRALRIGREHIASLINTLVLAYAGSAMIYIFYVSAAQNLPLWLVLNSELMMEEIIRSLIGSIALILAVPLTTLLAALLLSMARRPKTKVGKEAIEVAYQTDKPR